MFATRPYRQIIDDHREAARSLQRYGGALPSGFAIAQLHHHRGHDHHPLDLNRSNSRLDRPQRTVTVPHNTVATVGKRSIRRLAYSVITQVPA